MKAFVFPGQGIQRKGMGSTLLPRYPELVSLADEVLGYSIASLCLEDPHNELNLTAFTQPAIYVVSYLGYLAAVDGEDSPDFLVGHSVGEYAALAAADVFDFATGLRIVQMRAALMAQADAGGLAAVLGRSQPQVTEMISASAIQGIEIANINSPSQIVVGGPSEALQSFVSFCSDKGCRALMLKVSGPFHTSHMKQAQQQFRTYLADIPFQAPSIPVIANLTAEPHLAETFPETLARHIASPVQWKLCIEYLLNGGVEEFIEIGSPAILTPMIDDIRSNFSPADRGRQKGVQNEDLTPPASTGWTSHDFCQHFSCSYPFVIGSLGNGGAGPELISSVARHGVLSILDTEALDLDTLDMTLAKLAADETTRGKFGAALNASAAVSDHLDRLLQLFRQHDIRCIEVRGQSKPSAAISRFREESSGETRLLARVQDAEAAKAFLTEADAVCIDLSAPHTTQVSSLALVLEVMAQREALISAQPHRQKPLIGVGGIAGSAPLVEALLALGADFVMGGSAFLITREASLPAEIKSRLRQLSYRQYRPLPDWRFPEFATSSFCYVLDEAAALQSIELQRLYLEPQGPDLQLIRSTTVSATNRDSPLIPESLFDDHGKLNAVERRARLRRQLSEGQFPSLITGDSSLMLLNLWLNNAKGGVPTDISAKDLTEMLCPTQARPSK
ncbi:[acyl-carrier-protein] S-malonyltransferase [Billgrantia azerbaijanica]|nr:[acyl-carrier-protein] S-malonyltransferase [Halomonas azerbaijanica]